MLVGNKSDLRQDGVNCVPTSYGEKLAMVMTNKHPLLLNLLGHFNGHVTHNMFVTSVTHLEIIPVLV